MKLSFKNNKEKSLYHIEKSLVVLYGERQARKIVQRISELEAADNPQKLPKNCRFHEHSGKRKGLYSVDLAHPLRLILLPTCSYKNWVEITSFQVYEVMDPH
mgnify:CR=1 FL=1